MEFAIANRVADEHRSPQPFHIGAHQNGRSIPMALSFHNISGGGGWSQLRDTLRGYFVRYRLALYLVSAAAVALGACPGNGLGIKRSEF
jgi:hypothetical protein